MVYSWSPEQTTFLLRNYHRISSKEMEGYGLFENKSDDAIRQKAHRMGLKRSKKPDILIEYESLQRQNSEMELLLKQLQDTVDRFKAVEQNVQEINGVINEFRTFPDQIAHIQNRLGVLEKEDRSMHELKALMDRFNTFERKVESIEKKLSTSYI